MQAIPGNLAQVAAGGWAAAFALDPYPFPFSALILFFFFLSLLVVLFDPW